MKRNSLCFRLTVMTGAILLLCSIALTLSASYNAGRQLTTLAAAIPVEDPTVLIPGQVVEGDLLTGAMPVAELSAVTAAKRNFDLVGLLALAVISALGTGTVYFATKRAMRPIQELNEQITAITENNLDERVSGDQRTDEVGTLCRSFNIMLERLSSSFSAQKQFSANVAHELKTPLATMSASVQVLRLDPEPSAEDYKKMLTTVERNTDRLREIVENLMQLCDEQAPVEMENVELRELLLSAAGELKPMLAQRRITAEIDCEALTVRGNYALLYRAFFNLIENAAKYNRDGGNIRVSSKTDGRVGTIEIADTGVGIQADELEHIFEPFYRVNKSRSRKTGGSGLGLSVVKTIMERHGWNISVDSTFGKGTTFSISFYLDQ